MTSKILIRFQILKEHFQLRLKYHIENAISKKLQGHLGSRLSFEHRMFSRCSKLVYRYHYNMEIFRELKNMTDVTHVSDVT